LPLAGSNILAHRFGRKKNAYQDWGQSTDCHAETVYVKRGRLSADRMAIRNDGGNFVSLSPPVQAGLLW